MKEGVSWLIKLYLAPGTIETMLISSTEIYPAETLGLTFGNIVNDEYNCIVSYPVQFAIRNVENVSCDQEIIKRIAGSARTAHGYRFLGCYHSHPKGGVTPSDGDIEVHKQLNLSLVVIISIEEVKGRTTSFAIGSSSIDLEMLGYKITIKPYYIGDKVSVFNRIISPFVEVNRVLQTNFGISTLELAALPAKQRELVEYSLKKFAYNVKRQEMPGKREYSKQNTAYHIERIRRILAIYKFDRTS